MDYSIKSLIYLLKITKTTITRAEESYFMEVKVAKDNQEVIQQLETIVDKDNTNDGSNEVQPPTTPDTEVETPSDGNMNGGGNEVQSPITPDSGTGTNNNNSQTPQPEETVTPNEQQSQNLEDSLQ
mgnify:CR=1 FL=1